MTERTRQISNEMITQLPLFDANGSFGKPCRTEPEYPTAAAYLTHLDRLGVQRGLVYSVEGSEFHPATGNRKLLAELDATPGAHERLAPALVIGMQMRHEAGAMEELKAMMRTRRIRALRAFPTRMRHTLGQLEPVIEELAAFEPTLFLDSREGVPAHDLLAFANRFPSVPMVYMQGMWGNLPIMFDLLRRCPNIVIETSWIHSRNSIELMAREFGAKRLIFGLGYRSHAGASIAELAHLDLDPAGVRLLAHENLERLLGLRPGASEERKPAAPLFQRLLEGRPIELDLVDAHGHMGPLGRWLQGDAEWEEQIPDAVRRMDKIGIKTMIVSGLHAIFSDPLEGNRLLEARLAGYGERFRGYFVFNPCYADELVSHFDEFFAHPFWVGFKVHTSGWCLPVTDPRFEPMFAYANRRRLPILFHTWDGPYDTPSMFTKIVKRHPEAIFIMGHSGGGTNARIQAEQLAAENPNVFLEWCGSFTTPRLYEGTLRRVGADRVLFGTDGMLHSFAWELGRFLSLDLPEAQLRPALGPNMRRILALRR